MTIEELKALFETGKEITQEMFETLIDELQSKDGKDGKDGSKGDTGAVGKSAYEVAVVEDDFEGTVQDWLESLKGGKGDKGNDGPQGESGAQGETGEKGEPGTQGAPGNDGADGFGTEEQYNALVSRIESLEGTLEEPEEPED